MVVLSVYQRFEPLSKKDSSPYISGQNPVLIPVNPDISRLYDTNMIPVVIPVVILIVIMIVIHKIELSL